MSLKTTRRTSGEVRKAPASAVTKREPLAEGIRKRRPRGFFKKMSDDELVEYAKRFIEEKGIKNRYGLQKEDRSLYYALLKRGLFDNVGLEMKGRNWASVSDEELVEYARKFINKKKIKNRKGLEKEDYGLYQALRKRKLLDRVGLGRIIRKGRNWASMTDGELVEHARRFMEEKGIKSRKGLEKEDCGLYDALRKRKLLDRLEFEEGRRKMRSWASMNDGELVEYARRFIEEKKVKYRTGLAKEDGGLYHVLRKRKLLNKVGLEKIKRRPRGFFKKMSDDELVKYAIELLGNRGLTSRYELEKNDVGLYGTLRIRKLLDLVFAPIEQAKEKQAVQDVFDALSEFGGPG